MYQMKRQRCTPIWRRGEWAELTWCADDDLEGGQKALKPTSSIDLVEQVGQPVVDHEVTKPKGQGGGEDETVLAGPLENCKSRVRIKSALRPGCTSKRIVFTLR